MRSRVSRPERRLAASFGVALLVVLGAAGCGHLPLAGPVEEVVIDPAVPAGTSDDLDLGPGVRPFSLGPGDKSSPRISPSGDRLAFVLDGYAVEKSLHAQDPRRRTEEGFSATSAEWLSEKKLAVLGPRSEAGERDEEAGSLSVTRPGDPPGMVELADGVRTTAAQANGSSIAAVLETPGGGVPATTILRIRAGGDAMRIFPVGLRGRVSGISLSPDGREVVLAVRVSSGEDAGRVEIVRYSFYEGNLRRTALLDEGLEVIGAPQSTARGIYFVAGEEGDDEADYALYRVPAGSEEYEPARGIGEDFIPASVAVSPDGDGLAVLGRRNARSPTDLYVLDLASDALDAVTANENMEIKTKPRDLAWSPDGSYVLVVARGILPGPKVYGSPAKDLSSAFYNVYGVPVGKAARTAKGRVG